LPTTTTSTSTIISTLTSITTSFAPQATYYAACAPNNLVSRINGNGIDSLTYHPGIPVNDISYTAANSPYDCCVQCVSQSTCAGSFFYRGNCELYAPTNGGAAQVGASSGSDLSVVLSNGYRGYYTYP
jgi:hypothetical protein